MEFFKKGIDELIKEVYLPDFIKNYPLTEEAWRKGHEDLGPTGPYSTIFSPSAGTERSSKEDTADIDSLLPPIQDTSSWGMIIARVYSISNAVAHTCMLDYRELDDATDLISNWMKNKNVVRILGAGRALLAGTMPGNRMAHGGAQVSFMGGNVPMPNSLVGGGIIACSASGKTKPVLEAMNIAKKNNHEIKIIGLASNDAKEFKQLCDVFIGIHLPKSQFVNPLSALADTEEYVISEILDGLVVMAGKKNGYNDDAWRRGHEDIGPTGPYAPELRTF